jgi:hypothetical protein
MCRVARMGRVTMTFEHAIALFAVLPMHEQESVVAVFDGIKTAFPDVRDAFIQAVADEAYAIETEMLLLQPTGTMQ